MNWNISAWSIRHPVPALVLFMVLMTLVLASASPPHAFSQHECDRAVLITQSVAERRELEVRSPKGRYALPRERLQHIPRLTACSFTHHHRFPPRVIRTARHDGRFRRALRPTASHLDAPIVTRIQVRPADRYSTGAGPA